jgi:signal transduction histidine kinase/CheY-like chemotaxis protein
MLSSLRMHNWRPQCPHRHPSGQRLELARLSAVIPFILFTLCPRVAAQTPPTASAAVESAQIFPLSLLCATSAVIVTIVFLVLFNQKLQREVRERKKAEQRLRISEGEKAAVLDSMTEAVVFLDPSRRLIWANRVVREKNPTLPDLPMDRHCHEILAGTAVPCEGCPVVDTLVSGVPRESSIEDTTGRCLRVKAYPVSDEEIGISGVVVSHRDITESRRLQEELLKNRKLESVGVLAGGIAHDFNNMLTAVMGYISLAELREMDEAEAPPFLRKALEAATRAKHLASRLLTFSQGGHPIRRPVAVSMLLESAVQSAIASYPVELSTRVDPQCNDLSCDEAQVRQAIENVIVNACESMPAGGEIRLEAVCRAIETGLDGILSPGHYLQISVCDRGAGIPREIEDKIFDPYFTTKPMGTQKGAGLGLAITHSILQKHQGHITAERRLGGGTRVRLFLPLDAAAGAAAGAATTRTKPVAAPPVETSGLVRSAERILVLEDEPLVWETAEMLLTHLGYQVTHAPHGEAAVAIYAAALETDRPFTSVILDLTIKGGMGGREALAALKRIDPEVRAFVSSGYNGDPVLTGYRSFGFNGVIPKPYTLDELKRALASKTSGEIPN